MNSELTFLVNGLIEHSTRTTTLTLPPPSKPEELSRSTEQLDQSAIGVLVVLCVVAVVVFTGWTVSDLYQDTTTVNLSDQPIIDAVMGM